MYTFEESTVSFYTTNLIFKFLITSIILGIALSFSACGVFYEREVEPNDTYESPMSIRAGKQVKATIETDGDVDFYKLAERQKSIDGWEGIVTGNGIVVAQIRATGTKDLDLVIKILKDNRVIKIVNDYNHQRDVEYYGEEIVNAIFSGKAIQAGKALFAIEKAPTDRPLQPPSDRSYTLVVNLRAIHTDEEREPNDKPVLATRFDETNFIEGFFDPAMNPLHTDEDKKEVDWFSFTVPGTARREVVHISLSAVPNVDSVISLYDELGYLIRSANSNGVGEMEKLMSVGLSKGHYYIKVESAASPQKNSKVGYLLKIENEREMSGEYEPNDRYMFANTMRFSQDTKGYINPVGDIDWYRMNIYEPEPQVISVKISPTEDIDPVIEFYGSSAELLHSTDDRGVDEGEIIKNIGVHAGIYFVKIFNRIRERENSNSPYTVVIEKRKWEDDEEFEINDSLERANSLVLSGLKRGYITPKGDRDFYSFQVERPLPRINDLVMVNLELTPCILLDVALNVWNANGELIAHINNNPAEEGETETLWFQEGNYFVEVLSMNAYENSRDAYTLRIYGEQ